MRRNLCHEQRGGGGGGGRRTEEREEKRGREVGKAFVRPNFEKICMRRGGWVG